jgi:hypothetical protein
MTIAVGILFQRGLLDPTIKYTKKGRIVDGITDPKMRLELILGGCEDFRNEVSATSELMTLLGHNIDQTPRKHPEIAGRGIEYSWGNAKLTFRRSNDYCPNAASLERRDRATLDSGTVLTRRQFLVAASGRQTTLGAWKGGASPSAPTWKRFFALRFCGAAPAAQQNSVSSHERSSSFQSHLKLPTPLRNYPERISPRQGL